MVRAAVDVVASFKYVALYIRQEGELWKALCMHAELHMHACTQCTHNNQCAASECGYG